MGHQQPDLGRHQHAITCAARTVVLAGGERLRVAPDDPQGPQAHSASPKPSACSTRGWPDSSMWVPVASVGSWIQVPAANTNRGSTRHGEIIFTERYTPWRTGSVGNRLAVALHVGAVLGGHGAGDNNTETPRPAPRLGHVRQARRPQAATGSSRPRGTAMVRLERIA